MNNYLNKKAEICEKLFGEASSTFNMSINKIVGVITNIYDNKFIEIDNKILLSLDYIYKIEIVN